jgi:hypothetical protein
MYFNSSIHYLCSLNLKYKAVAVFVAMKLEEKTLNDHFKILMRCFLKSHIFASLKVSIVNTNKIFTLANLQKFQLKYIHLCT